MLSVTSRYGAAMSDDVPPCSVCDSPVRLRRPEGWEPGDEQQRICTKRTCPTNSDEKSLAGPYP